MSPSLLETPGVSGVSLESFCIKSLQGVFLIVIYGDSTDTPGNVVAPDTPGTLGTMWCLPESPGSLFKKPLEKVSWECSASGRVSLESFPRPYSGVSEESPGNPESPGVSGHSGVSWESFWTPSVPGVSGPPGVSLESPRVWGRSGVSWESFWVIRVPESPWSLGGTRSLPGLCGTSPSLLESLVAAPRSLPGISGQRRTLPGVSERSPSLPGVFPGAGR